jgi:hypothetical protein
MSCTVRLDEHDSQPASPTCCPCTCVSSCAGLSSITICLPEASVRSKEVEGAAMKKGTPWCLAATACHDATHAPNQITTMKQAPLSG